MASRKVSEADVVAVVTQPQSTWHDPKEGSMVLTGRTASGRTLIVWVVGDRWPQSGTIRVKSTAWRDEE